MAKYTKEQLQAMSDFKVNKTLAESLGNKLEQYSIVNIGLQCCIVSDNGTLHQIPDYCNTPNDIMPLAFEHGVGVMPYTLDTSHENYAEYKDMWFAQKGVFDFEQSFDSRNPLRAAACCLILVLQKETKNVTN